MRRFLRQNIYWLLVTGLLLGMVIYEYPRPKHKPPLSGLFSDEQKLMHRKVEMNFDDVPLTQVIAALEREAQCTVVLDTAFIPPAFPIINITLHSPEPVTLEQAIDMVLAKVPSLPAGTASWMESGVVMIGPRFSTTVGPRISVVYDVSPLLEGTSGDQRAAKMDRLVKLIELTYLVDRGNGSVDGVINSFDDKIIVRTTQSIHEEIADFLKKMSE